MANSNPILVEVTRGSDGRGVPVIAMPRKSMALAMARLGKSDALPDIRAAAATRIVAAMTTSP